MMLLEWLELAAVWDLDGVELTSYYFTSEDPQAMDALKAKAFKLVSTSPQRQWETTSACLKAMTAQSRSSL